MLNDIDIRPLAAAVIIQAVKDARDGDIEARAWLLHDGLFWLEACGIDADQSFVLRGLNSPATRKRRRATNGKTHKRQKTRSQPALARS